MKKIPTAKINFFLFSILLIITPFLMLMNFLQNAIGRLSRWGFEVMDVTIPYVLLTAIIFLATLFIFNYKKMNLIRWLSLGFIILLFALGQMTSDYYFGHHFYDLQHNWHYFAYGIFSFLAYRRFNIKERPIHKIMWLIFIYAFAISLFDEFIQVYISNRIFDICDVAKDLWGSLIGQIVVFFFLREGKDLKDKSFMQPKMKMYFIKPMPVLALQFIFCYLLLFTGSMLTEIQYLVNVFLIVIPAFAITFFVIVACKNKIFRWITLVVLAGSGIFTFVNAYLMKPQVKVASSSLIYLNSIPLPYFDYMIYPEGGFRPVDKKIRFNVRDKQKMDALNPDILVISTGSEGQGGRGWNDQEVAEFYHNTRSDRIYQIIKLKTPNACRTFNRLITEKKKALLIIHNN